MFKLIWLPNPTSKQAGSTIKEDGKT